MNRPTDAADAATTDARSTLPAPSARPSEVTSMTLPLDPNRPALQRITSRPGADAPGFRAPSQTLSFRRRQALYHNGDAANSLYRVTDGLVRITRMTPEGRVLTVRHVLPGDFFGETALTAGEREEMAEALTATRIEAIDPSLIDAGDLMTVTRSLTHQMQRLMDYGYHLNTGDLRQRVARYLLELSSTPLASRDEHGRRIVAATHELIAEGTASTRESVSKIITELREEGLILSGYRSVTLLDEEGLETVAEGF
jgi:CRP/FNR family transcriptional regulator, LitR-dependent transcriptional activator